MHEKHEVVTALRPMEEDVRSMYREAFRRWLLIAPIIGVPDGRVRATNIQALLVDEARTRWGDRVVVRRGRNLVRISRDIVGQLKKLGPNGLPRNYPTLAALEFERARLPLPGIPEQTRVTIGYQLNATNTELARVSIVAQDGKRLLWSHDIELEDTKVVPLAATTVAPLPKRQRRRYEARPEVARARGNKRAKRS